MNNYTEKIEKQTLIFYTVLEIALGLWMAFSNSSNQSFIRVAHIYAPLWILSIIFVFGGLINVIMGCKHFWLYVLLTSTPLTFLGLVFLQVAIVSDVFTSNVILCNFVGIYSVIRAGQIFQRRKIILWEDQK